MGFYVLFLLLNTVTSSVGTEKVFSPAYRRTLETEVSVTDE